MRPRQPRTCPSVYLTFATTFRKRKSPASQNTTANWPENDDIYAITHLMIVIGENCCHKRWKALSKAARDKKSSIISLDSGRLSFFIVLASPSEHFWKGNGNCLIARRTPAQTEAKSFFSRDLRDSRKIKNFLLKKVSRVESGFKHEINKSAEENERKRETSRSASHPAVLH